MFAQTEKCLFIQSSRYKNSNSYSVTSKTLLLSLVLLILLFLHFSETKIYCISCFYWRYFLEIQDVLTIFYYWPAGVKRETEWLDNSTDEIPSLGINFQYFRNFAKQTRAPERYQCPAPEVLTIKKKRLFILKKDFLYNISIFKMCL